MKLVFVLLLVASCIHQEVPDNEAPFCLDLDSRVTYYKQECQASRGGRVCVTCTVNSPDGPPVSQCKWEWLCPAYPRLETVCVDSCSECDEPEIYCPPIEY